MLILPAISLCHIIAQHTYSILVSTRFKMTQRITKNTVFRIAIYVFFAWVAIRTSHGSTWVINDVIQITANYKQTNAITNLTSGRATIVYLLLVNQFTVFDGWHNVTIIVSSGYNNYKMTLYTSNIHQKYWHHKYIKLAYTFCLISNTYCML